MMLIVDILFLLACFVILSILLYPLESWIRHLLFKKPVKRSEQFLQPVSIIIACYNEEKYIRQKLESFLHPDEWIPGSEIIVISTGSTDNTNTALDEFEKQDAIRVIKSPSRISKIAGVNMAVTYAKHQLLVFSDCRQQMKKHSVKNMIHNFNDPDVGTVVSILRDHNEENGYSLSRRVLNFCAWCDSQVGSGLNVYGALYAQRKSVFRAFPSDLLFDDLFTVVSTIVQGKRLIQEPKAVIYDFPFYSYYGGERIQRLARGLLIFLFKQRQLIFRMPFGDLYRFLVFKYFKLLLPYSLIMLLLTSMYYMPDWITSLRLFLIACFTGLLFAIPTFRKPAAMGIRINYYFIIATFRFIFLKERSVSWQKLKLSPKSIHPTSEK